MLFCRNICHILFQIDIEEAIAVSEFQKLKFEAVNLALNLGEFEMILNALKDSCSKDAIAVS